MKLDYSLIAGYALLASGCVGSQCLPRCQERTRQLEQETVACNGYLSSIVSERSPAYREFMRHFRIAADNALGAPAVIRPEFFDLDPDHFEDHRDAVLDVYSRATRQHPWMDCMAAIPYEVTQTRPPYDRYTRMVSPQEIAETLRTTRPPNRKTTLGEIIDALDDLFGWLFHERHY